VYTTQAAGGLGARRPIRPSRPALALQRALRGLAALTRDRGLMVAADGRVGPATVAAVNRAFTKHIGPGQAPAELRTGALPAAMVAASAPQLAALVLAEARRRQALRPRPAPPRRVVRRAPPRAVAPSPPTEPPPLPPEPAPVPEAVAYEEAAAEAPAEEAAAEVAEEMAEEMPGAEEAAEGETAGAAEGGSVGLVIGLVLAVAGAGFGAWQMARA
jgi:hypothetical protein